MSLNRNFFGHAEDVAGDDGIARSVCGIFPSQAAVRQSLNVLIWHPDREDFSLSYKPGSQHVHTFLCVPVCRCRGVKPWGPEQIPLWLMIPTSNKNINWHFKAC